jgi:hypothetical protein
MAKQPAQGTEMIEAVEQSVGTLYANLIKKRQATQQKKQEEKRLAKEAKEAEDLVPKEDEPQRALTRKEKNEAKVEHWAEQLRALTGDDLDYVKPKRSKKKYKKWIDDDTDGNIILQGKPKKKKKVNHNKEFEAELNMLKAIVTDQNKFTVDLNKRFQTMVGPNTKDAGPMSKTAVELASAVINSRSNSLAIIREIGSLKKTVAQLIQKDKEIAAKAGGEGFDAQDLTMMGSNIGASLMNQSVFSANPDRSSVSSSSSSTVTSTPTGSSVGAIYDEFDPESWTGDAPVNTMTKYENTNKKTMVEYRKSDGQARYKTINTDTGEELTDYPNPTFQLKGVDPDNKMAKDSFDTVYEVEVIE